MEYLKQFSESKLDKDNLNKLIVKAQNGDSFAKDKVFRQHIKLVFKHTKKILPYSINEYRKETFKDAVQEGFIGLNRAIEKYDPNNEKNCAFSSYAYYWIRVYILKFIMKNYSLIRIKSTSDKTLFYRFSDIKYLDSITDENERARLEEKILSSIKNADNLSLSQARKTISTSILSIDSPITTNTDKDSANMHDVIANNKINPEEQLIQNRLHADIKSALSYLKPDSQYVIKKRYLDGNIERLAKIGEKLNLSGERIRQIEEHSLAKLKRLLENKPTIKERLKNE